MTDKARAFWQRPEGEEAMFLPTICIIALLLALVLSGIYLFSKLTYYKKQQQQEKKLVSVNCMPEQISNAVLRLSEKKYGYIKNYIIFQLTNKVFGLVSIVFSLIGLMSLSLNASDKFGMDKWLSYAICFISILFVILALYLSPVSRVFQYISAWKKCEKKMNVVVASTCYYASLQYIYNKAVDSKKAKAIEIATRHIMNTAQEITNTINDAEELLTTDGE